MPNCEGAKIALETKINIEFLESHLKDYDDISVIKYCKHGWPINIVETEFNNRITHENHKSAVNFPDEMNKYITEELDHGSLLGPFECNPFSNPAIISPLSTCEKRGSDERRVIMDLSFPPGNSVNERIPKDRYNGEEFSLTFPSIDALVDMVKIKGPGCMLMKRDLKRAYKQILVDPRDWRFLCLNWDGKLYFDKTMPMGLRSSGMCCQRITNAIRYIYQQFGFDLVPYLDDLATAETPERSLEAFKQWLRSSSWRGWKNLFRKRTARAHKWFSWE